MAGWRSWERSIASALTQSSSGSLGACGNGVVTSVRPEPRFEVNMDAIPHTAGIFWIATRTPGRLAILLRPASGPVLRATVEDWLSAGIETVVCLMEESELRSLGLEREGDTCREVGLEFI